MQSDRHALNKKERKNEEHDDRSMAERSKDHHSRRLEIDWSADRVVGNRMPLCEDLVSNGGNGKRNRCQRREEDGGKGNTSKPSWRILPF